MKNNVKIAIIGGTGKSGTYLVRELLNRGYNLKALVRNSDNLKTKSPLLEVIQGSVDNLETVKDLISGCTAVISTLGMGIPSSEPTIFSTATRNILSAMNQLHVNRYVAITGLNVDTPDDEKSQDVQSATNWMYTNYPISTADRQIEYRLLTESELDWTLVRLPLIELTNECRATMVSLKDCPGNKVSATDLAHFLIGQMEDKTYLKKAPFISS